MTQLKEYPGRCYSEGTGILCDCNQSFSAAWLVQEAMSHSQIAARAYDLRLNKCLNLKRTITKTRLNRKLLQGH